MTHTLENENSERHQLHHCPAESPSKTNMSSAKSVSSFHSLFSTAQSASPRSYSTRSNSSSFYMDQISVASAGESFATLFADLLNTSHNVDSKSPISVRSKVSFMKSPHSVKVPLPFAKSENALFSVDAPGPPGRLSRRDTYSKSSSKSRYGVSTRGSSGTSSVSNHSARRSANPPRDRRRSVSADPAPKVLKCGGLKNTRSKQRSISCDAAKAVEMGSPLSSRRNRRNEVSISSDVPIASSPVKVRPALKYGVSARGRRRSVSADHAPKICKGALKKTRSKRRSISYDELDARGIANVLSSDRSQRNVIIESSGNSKPGGSDRTRRSNSDDAPTMFKSPAFGVKFKRRSMSCDSVLDTSEERDGQRGDPYSIGITKSTSYIISTKNYDGCKEISHGEQELEFEISAKDHDGGKKTMQLNTDEQRLLTTLDNTLQVKFDAEAYVKVQNLGWVEQVPPFRKGIYTGVIDKKARPHGRGKWDSGNALLNGWWYKGEFIPPKCLSLQVKMSAENEDIVNSKFEVKDSSTAKSCLKSKVEKKRHLQVMDYKLGETLRSRTDMAHDRTGVVGLDKHDCAFVKRSNGTYSYAMVIDRFFDPMTNGNRGEEVLVFIVNNKKSTKSFPSSLWAQFIRCVAVNQKNYLAEVDKDDKKQHREFSTSEPLVACHISPTCVQDNIAQRLSRPLTTRPPFSDSLNSGASELSPDSDALHYC